MPNQLNCVHFEQKKCLSCRWLETPYAVQIEAKTADIKRLLSPYFLQNGQTEWLSPILSPTSAFRNKAKMVVSGSVEKPILGILNEMNDPNSAVDLTDCPLYSPHFQAIFPLLKTFIGRAGLVPYNVAKRRGELKYILITESRFNGAFMIRFVLRSETKLPLIEREFASFYAQLPPDSVVSVNIQPQHAAVLEGEKEIFLSQPQVLLEQFNGIPLFIRPQGFFQTNPAVASELYRTAQQWVADLPIKRLWDLFCGVGGFGLHCANILFEKNPDIALTGIEISPSAIASATASAERLGLEKVSFASLDSANFAVNNNGEKPDLVIVNPPRRGIGQELASYLNELRSPYLIYSSCNAKTMAADFAHLSDYYLEKVQLFDMFPHTAHYEVLAFLRLKA